MKKTGKTSAARKPLKGLPPKAEAIKGGKRTDWTGGHIVDVKFPK